MAFEDNQNAPAQEHFYIAEIDLPIITGTCEIDPGVEGYGTPLSCPIQDGTSAVVTKTYYFCTSNAPVDIPVSPLYRCLRGISEDATQLTSGKGLAIRGGGTLSFNDFVGDPNLERTSAQAIKEQGTFFGKLNARQVFSGKNIRIKKYILTPDGTTNIDPTTTDDAQVTYYKGKELAYSGKDSWRLTFEDELARINFNKSQFPLDDGATLDAAITDTQVSFVVNGEFSAFTRYATPFVIRSGDELMTVTTVADLGGGQVSLTVATRGADIGSPQFTNFLSKTTNEAHDAGDEVFICYAPDGEAIDAVLAEILDRAGIDSAYIPLAEWQAVLNEWLNGVTVSTVFYEAEDANDALLRVLEGYMIDMWYEPLEEKIKISAVNNWQTADQTLSEGIEIDYNTLKVQERESERFTRAFVSYDKQFKTAEEKQPSYKKSSLAIRPALETAELYEKPKVKKFNPNYVIDKDAADLLVARYVQRYGFTPSNYTWTTQERFLTFKTGDVVTINSEQVQGFDGGITDRRSQIIKIQPSYKADGGREYKVTALTYQPAGLTENTITSGEDLNLYVALGAPSTADTYTVIFDGGLFCGSSNTVPSVRAGNMPAGSVINIILRNGADWQSKGGNGGKGGDATPGGNKDGSNGSNGGVCYDAEGIETNIYLSGADPLSGTADGTLRCGGGGGGGSAAVYGAGVIEIGGGGGGGGAGCQPGIGGLGGDTQNVDGAGGDTAGNGGAGGDSGGGSAVGGNGGTWGVAGTDGQTTGIYIGGIGGLAGSGIVKSGGVVRVFNPSANSFINGNGDTPD